jgi:formate-dependent phosphoribosylglycinamide formyltransferase (GAR transformylase)
MTNRHATRILLLSHTTGYQLRAFNDAAESLGMEIVFATDRCYKLDDPWQDRAIPVRFHELDAAVSAIARHDRNHPIHGVIAVGDRPVILAARAAETLGLPWHSVAGAQASTDKRRSRTAMMQAGLSSPRFTVVPAHHMAGSAAAVIAEYPCVLKPLGMSGSRGVIRANTPDEFAAAFDRICALLSRPQVRAARAGLEGQILIEDYVDGAEFALEGVLTHGVLEVFAVFDKPDPLRGPYFEETIYVTPSRLPVMVQSDIANHVRRAARAIGLSHGPIHAECRVTGAGAIYVLEVAARPIGGLCSKVLTFSGASGAAVEGGESDARHPLEEVLLQHAVGGSAARYTRSRNAAAVMMIPIPERGMYQGVDGEAAARSIPGVTDLVITAKVGQLLETLPESGSYLGFIFAEAQDPGAAEAAVRDAHRCLTFSVSRELEVRAI